MSGVHTCLVTDWDHFSFSCVQKGECTQIEKRSYENATNDKEDYKSWRDVWLVNQTKMDTRKIVKLDRALKITKNPDFKYYDVGEEPIAATQLEPGECTQHHSYIARVRCILMAETHSRKLKNCANKRKLALKSDQ